MLAYSGTSRVIWRMIWEGAMKRQASASPVIRRPSSAMIHQSGLLWPGGGTAG